MNDLDIAHSAELYPIRKIAENMDIDGYDDIIMYGSHKAKINDKCYFELKESNFDGKLILVTAMNPTPLGEGKTTMSIGLAQALNKFNRKTVLALREPSLGPVFGIKGGAAGGGYSQVLPMEDINLHFTGDFYAVATANNLLAAAIDNHIHHGNDLGINPLKIVFSRCMDMNDRALRDILIALGGENNGIPRKDSFRITAASEIMAILCLSETMDELRENLGNILIGFSFDNQPLYCKDLKMQGAMCVVLKEALMPNLVQTTENTAAIIHGGPFANIAHGCNSVKATALAVKLGEYAVTEAGFGADLGAEKFFNIKCRKTKIYPSCVVIVATIRALKYNGGITREELAVENLSALEAGSGNLFRHYENIRKFGVEAVVVINSFPTDTRAETERLISLCGEKSIPVTVSEAYAKGSDGSLELAEKVIRICNAVKNPDIKHTYETDEPVGVKIEKIAKEIYGAENIVISQEAQDKIKLLEKIKQDKLPVCMAKTQYSFTDNPKILGRPEKFDITIRDIVPQTGAGFIVALTGNVMTMPGLPKKPAAESLDVLEDGEIVNLF